MTSINALRLSHESGLLVCDEARYWNPEWLIILTPEKIRTLIEPEISRETGVFMFIGSTGTSSYGDEIMESIKQEISRRFGEAHRNGAPIPEDIKTVGSIAQLAFDVVEHLHHTHVDDFLRGRYGFIGRELVQGQKQKNGTPSSIDNEEIVKDAVKMMSFENNPSELSGLLNNAQVMAGYDPVDGFRIFFMEERSTVLEEVSDIYLAEGSGTITCDLTLSALAAARTTRDRRLKIDRVEGLITMLEGLDEANRLVAGIKGYPKIIYIDGSQARPEDRCFEISDCRSQLAWEIIKAGAKDLLDNDKVYHLVDQLIFRKVPFADVFKQFQALDRDKNISHFLRGFRIPALPGSPTSRKGGSK
ncbi:hypothetical protein JXQ70_18150 [bacterium]|nr:hypothetical protein [bacterium]